MGKKTRPEVYDVLVAGAGPAGATAAAYLAGMGRSVVMVDAQQFPVARTDVGWLNTMAEPLLEDIGVRLKSGVAEPFDNVTFLSADLAKEISPRLKGVAGYIVDRRMFDGVLIAAAKNAGCRFQSSRKIVNLAAGEECVTATLNDNQVVKGRVLVAAIGRAQDLLRRVGIPPTPSAKGWWSSHIQMRTTPLRKQPLPKIDLVLGLDNASAFGYALSQSGRVSVGINWTGAKYEAPRRFVRLCTALADEGIIDRVFVDLAARASWARSPAGVALEFDSHVGKSSIAIGDSGGFVAAVSNESLYPAMWSAQIAAEVVHAALDAANLQDALGVFETAWRTTMADYLRNPNTDVQFLLPLIFSNQQMADKMADAFFFGENM